MSSRCPDGHVSESGDYCDVCGQPMTASASEPPPLPSTPAPPGPASPPDPGTGASSAGEDKPCPACTSLVPVDDLFCEVCGYDFTTGVMPEPVTMPGGIPVPGDASAHLGGHATVTPPPNAGPDYPVGLGTPVSTDPSAPGSAGPDPSFAGTGTGGGPAAGDLLWVAEIWIDPDWYVTQEGEEPCPSAGMPGVVPLTGRSFLVGRRSGSRNIYPEIDCGTDHGVSRRHVQLSTDGQRWFAEDLESSNGTYIAPAGASLPTVPITPKQRIEFREGDRVYVGAWTRIVVRRGTPDEV